MRIPDFKYQPQINKLARQLSRPREKLPVQARNEYAFLFLKSCTISNPDMSEDLLTSPILSSYVQVCALYSANLTSIFVAS